MALFLQLLDAVGGQLVLVAKPVVQIAFDLVVAEGRHLHIAQTAFVEGVVGGGDAAGDHVLATVVLAHEVVHLGHQDAALVVVGGDLVQRVPEQQGAAGAQQDIDNQVGLRGNRRRSTHV